MATQYSSRRVAFAVALSLLVIAGTAGQEPRTPKRTFSTQSLLTAVTTSVDAVPTKFSGMTLVEEQLEKDGQFLRGPAVACFGIRKLGEQLSYTYFIVFKGEPK